MNGVEIATSLLSLVAGIGVFLISCTMMSSDLEALGSKRLKALFSKTAKSKLVGVGVGTITTAAIQSSSATSVMVIGFVNAGIMSLTQAATVIFGANIGTTITGQLVALGMFGSSGISSSVILATFAGIGAFILVFAKHDKTKKIGGILSGFGMLFVGLMLMSNSMKYFSKLDEVKTFLALFKNPLLLVLIGAILTAIIQSSSVMTSMAITMVVTGLITLNQGIYITMGSNVGTCATALLAGLASTRNAKRTALIHLIFNVSGVIVFMLVGLFISFGGIDYGFIFEKMFPAAPQLQMSMFHTIFNVVTVIIVLPLTNQLVLLVTKLIPDKKGAGEAQTLQFKYIEEHMLATPPIAAMQVKKEIINMAEIANANFNIASDMICTLDFDRMQEFRDNENILNFTHREINIFIAKLLNKDLSEKDRIFLSTAIRSATDLERVGDYAENITEYCEKLKANNETFSQSAVEEIKNLQDTVNGLFSNMLKAYTDNDLKEYSKAIQVEDSVDAMTEQMASSHIRRLECGECSPEVGANYLAFSSSVERIADHYINVAKIIKAY